MEAYLLHDANAGSNLKLMIMIQEEGMKGYGIYWTVLEFLRLQNEYKASLKVIPILAQKARVTTATLKRIIYDYALFEVNETSFSSPGLSRRMEPWDAQQEAKKEAGRRGGLVNQQRISACISDLCHHFKWGCSHDFITPRMPASRPEMAPPITMQGIIRLKRMMQPNNAGSVTPPRIAEMT